MVVSGAVGSIGLVSWVGVEALVGVILASHGSGSRATKFGIFVRIERTRSRAEGDRRVVRWVLEWWSLGVSEESIRAGWLGGGGFGRGRSRVSWVGWSRGRFEVHRERARGERTG